MRTLAAVAAAAVAFGLLAAIGFQDTHAGSLAWLCAVNAALFVGGWAASRKRSGDRLAPEYRGLTWVIGIGGLAVGFVVAGPLESYALRAVVLTVSGLVALLAIYLSAHPPERWRRAED